VIYVDRSGAPVPEALTRRGPAERQRAIEFYGKPENRAKGFSFSAYRDASVKEALERLFRGKCAYCESRYAGTQPMDVEHWRPKGEVHTEDGEVKQGYYWLAASWENLLPSCVDCNRTRKFRSGPDDEERLRGKGNRFPLAPGAKHAEAPDGEFDEVPLLLDPCVDHPEEHLHFIDQGVVRALTDEAGQPSQKALASIDVYNLNRTQLVHDRQETRLMIYQRIFALRQLSHILDDLLDELLAQDEPERDADLETLVTLVEDLIGHEMGALARFMGPEQPFSLMARQLIEAALGPLEE
jgi:uncharacterized protein (TIGR02646 family)